MQRSTPPATSSRRRRRRQSTRRRPRSAQCLGAVGYGVIRCCCWPSAYPVWCCWSVFHYVPLLGNVIAFQDYVPFLGHQRQPTGSASATSRSCSRRPGVLGRAAEHPDPHRFQLVFFFPLPIALALLLNSLISRAAQRLVQIGRLSAALPLLGAGGRVLPADARRRGLLNTSCVSTICPPSTSSPTRSRSSSWSPPRSIWKDVGWGTIIFLAALSRIDPKLYEAAAVDGAGRLAAHAGTSPCRRCAGDRAAAHPAARRRLSVGFEQFMLQRDAVGRRPPRCSTRSSTTTASSAATGACRAAAGLFKGVVGLSWSSAPTGSPTCSASRGCTEVMTASDPVASSRRGPAVVRRWDGEADLAVRAVKAVACGIFVLLVLVPVLGRDRRPASLAASRRSTTPAAAWSCGPTAISSRRLPQHSRRRRRHPGAVISSLPSRSSAPLLSAWPSPPCWPTGCPGPAVRRQAGAAARPPAAFLFCPGMIPSYLVVNGLGLIDSTGR